MVELNPYAPSTGAGLFDWKIDQNVLENGPCELRLRTEPLSDESAESIVSAMLSWQTAQAKRTHLDYLAKYEAEFTPKKDNNKGCQIS